MCYDKRPAAFVRSGPVQPDRRLNMSTIADEKRERLIKTIRRFTVDRADMARAGLDVAPPKSAKRRGARS